MVHRVLKQSRRPAARTLGVVATVFAVVLVAPVAAYADTPQDWADAPSVSGLDFLLVLFLIPLGVAAVISVLAALPSIIGHKGYEPGQAWRSEPEWFGGPRKGVEATADDGTEQPDDPGKGSTSARW